ncbi:unnamed protein product, partial [Rotaria sp. Silwood2]
MPNKFFILLIHSTAQELDHRSCFPSIFLHDWDFYFIDTCTPGSAFHLQKMLQIFTSSFEKKQHDEQQSTDDKLCNLNVLFDDCLWDFCLRIQIFHQQIPQNMFKNPLAREFYQPSTSTNRRVQCLKEILKQSPQLQKRIITIYYKNMSMNKNSLQKNCNSMYQMSKDILCGKRFTSLVDSLQTEIRISFTNFVSNILKFIVNDYGLETLMKLSTVQNGYESLLNLIDYKSFAAVDDDKTVSSLHGTFQIVSHYSSIPKTPLYHLFHQRIKSLADQIKSQLMHKQSSLEENETDVSRAPTTFNNNFDDHEITEFTPQQFRNKLTELLINDKILMNIVSQSIIESYTQDSIRTLCTIVEKNFNNNLDQCQQTIEFVSNWLLLIDENDYESLNAASNKSVWLLGHIYTSFEYEQNDLFSFYSACHITERLDPAQSFYRNCLDDNLLTRSKVRENLFRFMFDCLWKNLCQLCSTNDNIESWIHSYTFISKYYPSNKVLQHIQLVRVQSQIEFMNLAYLIFLNETISEPKQLILQLLKDTSLIHNDINSPYVNNDVSICLQLLPIIIQTVQKYFETKNINDSTLMIDIQQWIISRLKNENQLCDREIKYLFKFLNQPTCELSLSMKQFLFEELSNIYMEYKRQNRTSTNRQTTDFWDHISLLSIIIECVTNTNLENYQIPYHPSVINTNTEKQILIDLFFFYLQRLALSEIVNCALIKKIFMPVLLQINNGRLQTSAEILLQKFQDFFLLQMTALFLCQNNIDNYDKKEVDRILTTIINKYLKNDSLETEKLSKHVELFLSIIVSKRSWNFLLSLLKFERFQRLNAQWANHLHSLLEIQYTSNRNNYLQLCHQIQFTLTIDNSLSIFPKLHQPYNELMIVIDQCVQNTDQEQCWAPLSDWIQLKLNTDQPILDLVEIKVMLLLNIYYNYYCNGQLASLNTLLPVIENILQPSSEELRIFRAFLQPEQYMVGYPNMNNSQDDNYLNNSFRLDCQDQEELNIRHTLVNLLAMIMLGGRQCFLWTFTFEPLKLQNTFGFGSTARTIIRHDSVHYDCGCIISETGELYRFSTREINENSLNVPAVYVAYFATFGALAWHLLLFDTSVQNLNGPILSSGAINAVEEIRFRIAGNSIRAKVCHFVRARLFLTYNFLSLLANEDGACIILNRCFEQIAQLTRQHNENLWIKPLFTTLNDQLKAEQEFQTRIYYPVHEQLGICKKFINSLYLQSQIQKQFQEYISQIPVHIQLTHFKTELNNPKYSELSFNILRHMLDSFDFLKMTRIIYDLSQFYFLLHQTYAQLITKDEFTTVNLQELYQRDRKYWNYSDNFQNQNQNDKHLLIIENGIKAVNAYHHFTNGLIRPGACDETQRFTTITMKTPISYLVTGDSHDEGDIVMRIL